MGWARVPEVPGGCLIPSPATVRVGEACRHAAHGGAATAPEQVTEGTWAGGEGGGPGGEPRPRRGITIFLYLLFCSLCCFLLQ